MNRRKTIRITLLCLLLLLVVAGAFAAVGYMDSFNAVWPEANGTLTQSSGKILMDHSNMDKGYVMVCVTEPTNNRYKMRVTHGSGQLMYDVAGDGTYETLPLQLGSGNYKFELFENVSGNRYVAEGQVSIDVQLADESAAFLVPNQYVNYDILTAAVQKSDELAAGSAPADAYRAITNFMSSEFAYDFARAKLVSDGQLPDIDYCYANRMGICQDLAAVTCCMLRVQGVPARLMIGYADSYYHSWVTALVNGENVFFDPTAAIGALNAKKYSTERYY